MIADEINVKEVVIDNTIGNDIDLDTFITPELKEQGTVRDLIRALQELRKKNNLSPHDVSSLQSLPMLPVKH